MANTIRIKRRWTGGSGAPSTLKSGELAFSGVDGILYIGFGDDGSGTATSIAAIAGDGSFVTLTGDQTVTGNKTFSASPLVPTASPGDNTTKAASTAFVQAAMVAASVGDGSITNTKLADMPAATIKGNNTGSSATPADLTMAQVKTMLALAKGDVGLGNVDNTSDANKPVSTATQSALDLKAPLASPALTGTPTVPTAAQGTNTTQIASTAYVIAEIAARLAAADALVYKGAIDASANPNYPAADAGFTYRISAAGRIGGASGAKVEVGDMLICHLDGSAAGTHAVVGANWDIIQTNIDGALTTPDIGVSVQGYSANLQSVSELSLSANKGIYATGANTFATYDLSAGGRALGNAAGTANTFPYFSASNVVSLGAITAAGRALLDDADADAQRTTLGLGTMATQNANNVAITGGTIDGVTLDGGTY